MAITVAQIEALISVQTDGFDKATAAIEDMADSFDKKTDAMVAAITNVEAAINKISAGAARSSKAQSDAADEAEKAWNKQYDAIFKNTQAVEAFANKLANSDIKGGAAVISTLEKSLDAFNSTMESSVLNTTEFNHMQQNMTGAINTAKNDLNSLITAHKELANQQKLDAAAAKQADNAMASQANSVLRAEQQYKNLVNAIQNNITDEKKQTQLINEATVAFDKLKAAMSGGALTSPDATKQMLVFTGSLNDIKRSTTELGGLSQGLRDFGRISQLAFGPLSGATSRLGALIYLMDQAGVKIAALLTASTALAVGWGLSIKSASDFEMGITRVGVAADLTQKQTDDMSASMLELSKQLMIPTEELNKIAQSAATAGISGVTNITAFTKVVAELTRTTSLTADTAADSIIQLANVTKLPLDQIGKLGDMLTQVGQASVGSESQVLGLATELAKAGQQFGFNTKEAIAWAGALADTGQNAESSATAIVTAMNKIATVIEGGGAAFEELAKFLGMTDQQLKDTFQKDGPGLLRTFLDQVAKAPDVFEKLDTFKDLGLNNARMNRVLSGVANQADDVTKHLTEANNAAGALDSKFAKVGDTFQRQTEGLKVNLENIGTTVGLDVLKPLKGMIEILENVTSGTKAWADAFEAVSVIVLGLIAKWGTAKIWAQIDLVTTSVKALTAEMSVLEIATLAVGKAFALIAPVAVIGTILYGIDQIISRTKELKAAQDAAFVSGHQAPNQYSDLIGQLKAGGSTTGLQMLAPQLVSARDNALGQAHSMMANRTHLINEAGGNGETIEQARATVDDKIKSLLAAAGSYQQSLDDLMKGVSGTSSEIAYNSMALADKATNGALSDLDKLIVKAKQSQDNLNTLKTKGVDAFKEAKIGDSLTGTLDAAFDKAGKTAQSQMALMQETLKKYQGLDGVLGKAAAPGISKLQDALASKNFSEGKDAITQINIALADTAAKADVAANNLVGGMNKTANASQRAENAVLKAFTDAKATLSGFMDALGTTPGDSGAFFNALDSTKAKKSIADLSIQINKMSKEDLLDLQKNLGAASTDSGYLARMMYGIQTGASAASDGVRKLTSDIDEYNKFLLAAKKDSENRNFDLSLLGKSDYDKSVASAGHTEFEKYQTQIDKFKDDIDELNKKRLDPNILPGTEQDKALVDTINWLQALIDGLQNQLPDAVKEATDAVKKELDPTLKAQIELMDTLRSSFVDAATSAAENFNSIGSAFASMLKAMEDEFLKRMVFGPMADFLFGKQGGSGGGVSGGLISSFLSSLQFFADGGSVNGNVPIVVGEKGPELFVPSSNGQIISNSDAFGGTMTGGYSGGSSGGTQTIHLVVEASSEFNAKIVNVSGAVANQVVMSYDKKKLPTRVNQITNDPRAK